MNTEVETRIVSIIIALLSKLSLDDMATYLDSEYLARELSAWYFEERIYNPKPKEDK